MPNPLPNIGIVIVAAGSGTRFGAAKQLVLLNGLPLFLHSVRNFLPLCHVCVIVTPPGQECSYRQLAETHGISTAALRFVPGGACRTESVLHGLAALDFQDGIVAIHDAARPLATAALLSQLIQAAAAHGGAAPGHPVTDTLLAADGDNCMTGVCPRNGLWHIATPQVFKLPLLRDAYKKTSGQSFTDDTQVFFHAGYTVKIVPESTENFKITYPGDLLRAQEVLNQAH